jgi:hypothetical protein
MVHACGWQGLIINKKQMNTDENMEWEKEAPQLAGLPRTTPYSVPDNYFNNLQTHINQAVFVASLTQKENQGFTVPLNYFEDLANQIESKITVENINSLVKKEGFNTPVNYFENLQSNILSKTSRANPKPKVFRLWGSDLIKYASAACFIVLTASYLYINQQSSLQPTTSLDLGNEQVLYDIDEHTILEHLKESQTATNSVSDTEMESYILDNFTTSDLSNNL